MLGKLPSLFIRVPEDLQTDQSDGRRDMEAVAVEVVECGVAAGRQSISTRR